MKKGYAIRRLRTTSLGVILETLNRAAEWVIATNDASHATLDAARQWYAFRIYEEDMRNVFVQGPCGGRHSIRSRKT